MNIKMDKHYSYTSRYEHIIAVGYISICVKQLMQIMNSNNILQLLRIAQSHKYNQLDNLTDCIDLFGCGQILYI